MFKDAKEELERLENQLLWEDDESQAPDVPCYNTDRSDMDLEELTNELNTPPARNLTGLAVFMVILTLIILGLGYWLLRHWGVLTWL